MESHGPSDSGDMEVRMRMLFRMTPGLQRAGLRAFSEKGDV